MNVAKPTSRNVSIGISNRDIIDTSPLKYDILVHIQLLDNGPSDTGSGVSALNDLTHVDDMIVVDQDEDVPVG